MATALADQPRGLRLSHKLAFAILVLAALLLAVLFGYVGPATTAGFQTRSDELLRRSVDAMRELASERTRQQHDVLVDLIAHTTDVRQRALADLPLEIYRDPGQLLAAITADDAARGARLRGNAAALARETQRRADLQIAAVLDRLRDEQTRLQAVFASDLRATHLLLCGALLATALLLLLAGLQRLVVRPVATLRTATHRIAAGDLQAEVQVAATDELGALAADFSSMVRQLRQSRAELEALHANLEHEVQSKTRHLEQALGDLKRSHRELARAEKMASIGTLAGGVAHEFNNLIGGIRGCAAEARASEREPERQETLDVILRATDRAAAITAQLLRFARPGVDRRADVDVTEVLRDALRLVDPEARRRGVEIERALAGPLPVRGDSDALHQVFVNLATNALQAMPDGGRLAVLAGRAGDQVEIQFADTGVGIEPADLDRIFEPFFSRRPAGASAGGTGLGLSVSYGIVDAHGGAITVQSVPGRGTTFCVRLPLRGADPAGPPPA